jgi:ParB-like chromosome segregation protein Spo0J
MIFGHGRLLAARSAGMKTLEVKIYPASLTETQFRLIRAAENFHRTDLTAYQKWTIGTDLMRANPGWKLLDLAEHLHLDPSSVTRLMSPSKCIPAWQEALKDGRVGISDCYAASKLPESEQASLLALKLSGASRDQLEQASRKSRAATTTARTAVKLSRVRCPLSTGATVIVSGPAMTLEGLIESLTAALDAARKANKESLDVKTAQAVWKDKARVKE